MNVLISGISCPLGYYTALEFIKRGYKVGGFSRVIPKKQLEGVKYYSCNIEASSQLENIVNGYNIIIHIAALSSPWGKKKAFLKTNVEGTRNLLNAALKFKVKRFIYISSP